MTTFGQLLRKTERRFAVGGIGDARIEADLVWMTTLEVSRAELYARMADAPSDAEAQSAEELIQRRLRHEPTAYLLGHREFYNIDLLVGVGALIPRPDTEALVEEALRIAAGLPAPLIIADVGCGTGAIGLAIAANLPSVHVYATDLYPAALDLARRNTDRLGLAERVDVLEGDLLAPLPGPVDMITTNLPYVESGEIPTLDPEVRLYEPREALDGGDDGLDLIRRFLVDVPRYLKPSGVLLMEMDPRQIARASAFAADVVPGASIRIVQDLTRRDRVLVLEMSA
ncbi:MAG: peptide chain release factor N(5)-glutamine methyltransferase [Chloroflexi bacterium]|nr:peptide chain release factor N(5)-glutamine methyltransferase [Chloroflexota bacterium]MDA1172977.1 peptide chain release factor N(5)-glutamine methyltransferase [Chloroflexota bacterium]